MRKGLAHEGVERQDLDWVPRVEVQQVRLVVYSSEFPGQFVEQRSDSVDATEKWFESLFLAVHLAFAPN